MKRFFSFIVFFFIGIICADICSEKKYDPLLVVVLMVKDEATVMRATLEPFVNAGIDSFFIFDTGSTDETIEVTKEFFTERSIKNYVIEQEPFIDFSTSRNHALERAEQAFSQACFMLMSDAEWYLVNGHILLDFCQKHQFDTHPSYMLRIVQPQMEFYTQRLLRASAHARFAGVVHESIETATLEKVDNEVFFDLRVCSKGAQKTARRWLRDKDLLLKDHQEHPQGSRTCFYLAQTYECLGDLENAAHYYQKRSEMIGWPEEDYMTWYRLGGVFEQMASSDPNQWPQALQAYLKAYAMRPSRIEPLVKIAQYYLSKGDHTLAYLFCARACQIPFPENDVLFVERLAYDYTRYDILGQCSWYIGEYESGEKAVRAALKAKPELPHLLRNLAFYLDKKIELHNQRFNAQAA